MRPWHALASAGDPKASWALRTRGRPPAPRATIHRQQVRAARLPAAGCRGSAACRALPEPWQLLAAHARRVAAARVPTLLPPPPTAGYPPPPAGYPQQQYAGYQQQPPQAYYYAQQQPQPQQYKPQQPGRFGVQGAQAGRVEGGAGVRRLCTTRELLASVPSTQRVSPLHQPSALEPQLVHPAPAPTCAYAPSAASLGYDIARSCPKLCPSLCRCSPRV